MARALRLEFAGALYHVTAQGDERRSIFLGDADTDWAAFLNVLAASCEHFNWILHASGVRRKGSMLLSRHYEFCFSPKASSNPPRWT